MATDTAIWLKDLRAHVLQSSAKAICDSVIGLLSLEVIGFGGLKPCSYEGCYDYNHLAEGLKGSSADQP